MSTEKGNSEILQQIQTHENAGDLDTLKNIETAAAETSNEEVLQKVKEAILRIQEKAKSTLEMPMEENQIKNLGDQNVEHLVADVDKRIEQTVVEQEELIKKVADAGNTQTDKMESKEQHEFTVEEIRNLLKMIDGNERPNLAVGETIKNIKGELMSVTFTSGEIENIEGEDHEITYLLTLAGQRYKADGTEGRFVSKTFLTKDYDEGMYMSEEVADHIDGAWTNFTPLTESTSNVEQKRILAGEVLFELNEKGIEDPGTKERLAQFAIQCEQSWETKMPQDPNTAHLECALELAELYGQTEKYKEYAVESLEELLPGVEAGGEMEERILHMLKDLRG